MSKNLTNVATISPLANALVYNNRFANVRLNAEQITAESLKNWRTIVNNLHRAAYAVYENCENNGLKVDNASIDKTAVFDALRVLLADGVGQVNEHKLYANDEIATLVIGYAGKRANKDDGAVKAITEEIAKLNKAISAVDGMAGVNPDYVTELKAQKVQKEEEKKALLKTEDMRIKQPTMTTFNAFCLDVEHALARMISGQMAKSLEELDKEEEERKAARREKAKARKAEKAKANS